MKVRTSLIFLTIFIIGTIQTTGLNHLSLLGTKPDFLLITVIFFALYFDKQEGINVAILGGLFKDITSTAVFGSNAFGFCLCVLFLSRYGRSFYRQEISIQILLCALLYYIITFIILLINSGISDIQLFPYLWIIFKAALYTGCISPLLFFILSKIFKVKLAYA